MGKVLMSGAKQPKDPTYSPLSVRLRSFIKNMRVQSIYVLDCMYES